MPKCKANRFRLLHADSSGMSSILFFFLFIRTLRYLMLISAVDQKDWQDQ